MTAALCSSRNVYEIQSNEHAFAAILNDRSVVTWGHPDLGGDSRSVQHLLNNVRKIQATCNAFAALRYDGTVVTWGHRRFGGDSSAVQERLLNVVAIRSLGPLLPSAPTGWW